MATGKTAPPLFRELRLVCSVTIHGCPLPCIPAPASLKVLPERPSAPRPPTARSPAPCFICGILRLASFSSFGVNWIGEHSSVFGYLRPSLHVREVSWSGVGVPVSVLRLVRLNRIQKRVARGYGHRRECATRRVASRLNEGVAGVALVDYGAFIAVCGGHARRDDRCAGGLSGREAPAKPLPVTVIVPHPVIVAPTVGAAQSMKLVLRWHGGTGQNRSNIDKEVFD